MRLKPYPNTSAGTQARDSFPALQSVMSIYYVSAVLEKQTSCWPTERPSQAGQDLLGACPRQGMAGSRGLSPGLVADALPQAVAHQGVSVCDEREPRLLRWRGTNHSGVFQLQPGSSRHLGTLRAGGVCNRSFLNSGARQR